MQRIRVNSRRGDARGDSVRSGRGVPRDVQARDAAMRRLAMTNLLDLKTDFAYWNPGVADPSTESSTAEVPVGAELDDAADVRADVMDEEGPR